MKIIPQRQPSFRRAAGFFILALLALDVPAAAGETPVSTDRTWELKLADQSSGSFTEASLPGPDGTVTTKERMAMEINRLGSKVTIISETETVENRSGEMQAVLATISSSQAAT